VETGKTKDGRFLLIESSSHLSSEVRYLDAAQPEGAFRVLLERAAEVEYDVTHNDGWFWLRINDTARTFRIVKAPAEDPRRQNWVEVLPARPEVTLESQDHYRDHLAVLERDRRVPAPAGHRRLERPPRRLLGSRQVGGAAARAQARRPFAAAEDQLGRGPLRRFWALRASAGDGVRVRVSAQDGGLARRRDSELAADEAREQIVDFRVAGDCAVAGSIGCIHPPSVLAALADLDAAKPAQRPDQFAPLHRVSVSVRTEAVVGVGRGSKGSRISRTASRRFSLASSSVRPWVRAPGTSSVQAIHHLPCLRKQALIRRFAAMSSV
jgi:hypothetical protein